MSPPWKDISDIIQLYAMCRENKYVLSNRKKEIPSKEYANADNSVVDLLQGPQVEGCWNCVHDGPMKLDGSCETLQAESCFYPIYAWWESCRVDQDTKDSRTLTFVLFLRALHCWNIDHIEDDICCSILKTNSSRWSSHRWKMLGWDPGAVTAQFSRISNHWHRQFTNNTAQGLAKRKDRN